MDGRSVGEAAETRRRRRWATTTTTTTTTTPRSGNLSATRRSEVGETKGIVGAVDEERTHVSELRSAMASQALETQVSQGLVQGQLLQKP